MAGPKIYFILIVRPNLIIKIETHHRLLQVSIINFTFAHTQLMHALHVGCYLLQHIYHYLSDIIMYSYPQPLGLGIHIRH